MDELTQDQITPLALSREDAKRVVAALAIREAEIRAFAINLKPEDKGSRIIRTEADELKKIRRVVEKAMFL
jgi:hypothetical protein